MGAELFHIAIVSARDGVVARIPGGGSLEAGLIKLLTDHIMAKGVGFLRTEKHVERDIRDGIAEAILELKTQTKYIR